MRRAKTCNMQQRSARVLILCMVLFSVAMVTMWVAFYQGSYTQWTKLVPNSAAVEGEVDSDANVRAVYRAGYIPARESNITGGRNTPTTTFSARDVDKLVELLGHYIANVDKDVITMDVEEVLSETQHHVTLQDNRLIYKIQEAVHTEKKLCVIRVAIHCGYPHHCLKYMNGGRADAFSWRRFSCSIPFPCDIEIRFVSDIAADTMNMSDVVVFISSLHRDLRLAELMSMRPPGQLWALCTRESPQHDPEYAPPAGVENPYNLTITYSHEADIQSPYCYFRKKPVVKVSPLSKKTKLIAWISSNCHRLSWKRPQFVRHLVSSANLTIDTYGKCGELGPLAQDKLDSTLQQYKFYLALENSECRDYITEKVWTNALLRDIVPIVYGSRSEDYDRTLPPHSYINLEEFHSLSQFTDFINVLDGDQKRYSRYFDWKHQGKIICPRLRSFLLSRKEINICYLLRKLVHLFVHPETSLQKKAPDFRTWWQGQCSNVTERKLVLGYDVHRVKRSTSSNVSQG